MKSAYLLLFILLAPLALFSATTPSAYTKPQVNALLNAKAPVGSVAAAGSNALTMTNAGGPWPVLTQTFDGTPVTWTYTGGSDVAGEGHIRQVACSSTTVLTITPTSASVYRNGSTTALASTISVPAGNHTFRFWTPNTGSTVYLDDTVVTAADLPFTPAGNIAATTVQAAIAELDTEKIMPLSLLGTHASPDTSAGSITWTSSCYFIYSNTTSTYALPAASGYAGKSVIVYVTGSNAVTIDPNGSEVIVRNGTAQTGGVTLTLTGTAGNYVALLCDGTRWVTLGYIGTLAAGS